MIRHGFTLAEVLVTLGIVGVVAAMTVPNLIQKSKNDEYVTGMKKAYSTLNEIMPAVVQDTGTDRLGTVAPSVIGERLKCVSSTVSIANPDGVGGFRWDEHPFSCALRDGMHLKIIKKDISNSNHVVYGVALVDTNGKKKPNLYGRDRWVFMILENGKVVPAGVDLIKMDPNRKLHGSVPNDCAGSYADECGMSLNSSVTQGYYTDCKEVDKGKGYGCGARLLNNDWEMDY